MRTLTRNRVQARKSQRVAIKQGPYGFVIGSVKLCESMNGSEIFNPREGEHRVCGPHTYAAGYIWLGSTSSTVGGRNAGPLPAPDLKCVGYAAEFLVSASTVLLICSMYYDYIHSPFYSSVFSMLRASPTAI